MEKGHLRIKTGIDTTGVKAQIEQLENKISDLKELIKSSDEHPELFNEQEVLAYRAELEKSEKALKRLKNSTIQYQEVNTKTFTKGINSLKKFGLTLFSIRSIYSGISKASQTYLSQNEETANKLASIWTFMGNVIGPVIEWLADGILKLIGYLNEFLKVFKIDIVAKANAKALEKQAKAQQNLNRQMASFDEKNTLSGNNTTTGSLSKYGGIDLSGVQLNQDIVNKLQTMAKWLKENWYWIKEVGKVLGVVFGIATINKVLGGIGTLLGSKALGTGLLGLQGILVAIAGVYVITMYIKNYQEIKKQVEDLKASYDNLRESIDSATQKDKENANAIWDKYKVGEIGIDGLKNYKKALDLTTDSVLDQVASLEKNKTWLGNITGYNQEITKSQQAFVTELQNTIEEYEKLYETGAITKDEYDNFVSKVNSAITTFEKNGLKVDDLKTKMKNLTNDTYTVTITATLKDKVTSLWNTITQKLNQNKTVSSIITNVASLFKTQKKQALGGIITQPTRTLIAEAGYPEVTMPMTTGYLSEFARLVGKYSPNNNTPTTNNIYLDTRLIQRQIASREEELEFAKNG